MNIGPSFFRKFEATSSLMRGNLGTRSKTNRDNFAPRANASLGMGLADGRKPPPRQSVVGLARRAAARPRVYDRQEQVLVKTVAAATRAEAEDKWAEIEKLPLKIDALSLLSEALNFDFARKGMDEPFTAENWRLAQPAIGAWHTNEVRSAARNWRLRLTALFVRLCGVSRQFGVPSQQHTEDVCATRLTALRRS